jgi:hypothetical protein
MLYCWILGSFICFVCDFSFLWLIKGIALKPIMLNAWKKMIPFWRKTIIGVVVSCFSVYLCLYFCWSVTTYLCSWYSHESWQLVVLYVSVKYALAWVLLSNTIYCLNMHILNPDRVKNAWEIGVILSSILRDFTFYVVYFLFSWHYDKTLHWNWQPHISALLFFILCFFVS